MARYWGEIVGQKEFFTNTFLLQDIVWSSRVSPYNRPGCIGIKIMRAGTDDEGQYICSVQNSMGQDNFKATLLVDCECYISKSPITQHLNFRC